MEIRFLGFGGAFDTHLVNSSAIVSHSGVRTLIDCGHSVFPFLKNSGAIHQIDQVVITHLHDDHVGSLSALAIYFSKVLGKGPLPVLCANPEFLEKVRLFFTLSLVNPKPYCNLLLLPEGRGDISAIDTKSLHMEGLHTFAFVFREQSSSIVYSGDLGQCDYLFAELNHLNLPDPVIFHEISYQPDSRGHTYFMDLEKWTRIYPVYGYHCDPDLNPDSNPIPLVAHSPEFLWSSVKSDLVG
ncbi:MAG: ribonuclease Z [Bacteroidia bacterium]|nr:ribonuclease Z [Bacteroidia bacterium]